MGDVVNLRMVRKRLKRADAETIADTNRRFHGRSKAERNLRETEQTQAARHLDDHRLEQLDKPDE